MTCQEVARAYIFFSSKEDSCGCGVCVHLNSYPEFAACISLHIYIYILYICVYMYICAHIFIHVRIKEYK